MFQKPVFLYTSLFGGGLPGMSAARTTMTGTSAPPQQSGIMLSKAVRKKITRFIVFMIATVLCAGTVGCADSHGAAETGARNDTLRPSGMTRDRNWAVPLKARGLPNLFRVSPDVYRSAQPEAEGMLAAKDLGIRSVLSLRTSNPDPALSAGTGLHLERAPMRAWSIGEEELIAALRSIHDAPKPVLVHCMHGADRTGLVIAMYRIVFQGWSKADAKNEMLNGGFGFHGIWSNIPATIDRVDINAIRARLPHLPPPPPPDAASFI